MVTQIPVDATKVRQAKARIRWAMERARRGKEHGSVAIRGAVPFLESLGATIWDKMVELCDLVEKNDRVSVVGANSTSKDFTLGRLALWWVKRWEAEGENAKVVISGPTARQVNEIVWRELRAGYYASEYPLGGMMMPKAAHWELSNERFITGFVTTDYESSGRGIQGFHSPHLMVIITEAQSVKQDVIDAFKRLNPERLVLSGNPLSLSGDFFDAHHGINTTYQTMQISAYDTPNVKEGRTVIPGMVVVQDIERHRQDWGEDHPLFVATVYGVWPVNLGGGVVPEMEAVAAIKRMLEPGAPVVVACDVASTGMDKTVVVRRDGGVARIVKRDSYTDNIIELAQWLKSYCRAGGIDHLVVDANGLGLGVVDWLRTEHVRVIGFKGGANARDKENFANANAEVWWRMRQAFVDGEIDIENDRALLQQVTSRKGGVQKDRRYGLEPKENMSSSPDEADALAMTFAVRYSFGADYDPLIARKRVDNIITEPRNRSVIVVGGRR